jgi:hypothetical protein
MTQALRACERKRMKNIMTFQYDWNDEVIAQFYSTLWIKLADEESPNNFPYLNFYIEGSWYNVSYRRFAHILGFFDGDISGDKIKIHDFRPPTKDEARDLHISETDKYWESTNLHKFYRYINSLYRMTLIPKGGNQMNILGESKVLLSFMKPNSSESINIFDMIWQEIIHAACFPLKGCLHAPFIMKMIEVVSQFRFEKGTRHLSYTPSGLIQTIQQGVWGKPPPALVDMMLPVSRVPLLVADLPHHVVMVMVEVVVAGWELHRPMVLQPSFPCAGTYLTMCMSWWGISGRLTTTSVIKPLPWLCHLLPARLMCLFILLCQKSMNDTSKPMGCPSWQQKMMKKRKNILMIVSSMPRFPTRGIRVNLLHILHPRIHRAAILPQLSLGKKTLRLTWRLNSLIRLLLSGDLWLMVLSIFGASCQKGGEGLIAWQHGLVALRGF